MLSLAFIVTFLAHVWSAWVWSWILQTFKQAIAPPLAIKIYLTTNIAKYVPGNVGHFYGRIRAINKQGGSLETASITVLIEPILMATAALLMTIISNSLGYLNTISGWQWLIQVTVVVGLLIAIHPDILNPVMQKLSILKSKPQINHVTEDNSVIYLEQYPWSFLVGELGFLLLRGWGFLLVWLSLATLTKEQIPILLSAFSFAWLLGLIVPGAPGGLGIFEATMLTVLNRQPFEPAILLSAVALFRLISILAEIIAAKLAWLTFNQKET